MSATLCPACLSIRLDVSVVLDGEPCRKCGEVPAVRLSRREIRECLRAKYPHLSTQPRAL